MESDDGERRLSWIAVISPVLAIVICTWVLMVVVPELLPQPKPRGATCLINVKQQAGAMLWYAEDNNGSLPMADRWCDLTLHYCRRISVGSSQMSKSNEGLAAYTCPALDEGEVGGYAFNSALRNINTPPGVKASHTVVVFETHPGWNLHGGQEILLEKPRHEDLCVVGFLDGHCGAPKRSQVEYGVRVGYLIWNPSKKK
jgi:hypothetical protein